MLKWCVSPFRWLVTTTTVWLDLDAPDPTTRYKLAEVPHCEPTSDPSICPPAAALTSRSGDRRPFFKNGHFRIFGSGDGVEWKLLVNYTGEYQPCAGGRCRWAAFSHLVVFTPGGFLMVVCVSCSRGHRRPRHDVQGESSHRR